MPVEFLFSDVLEEIKTIKDLAEPLLEPEDVWKLDTFSTALETIRANRVWARWELPQDKALRTRSCAGGYEKRIPGSKRRGGMVDLHGELSALWEIQPIPEVKSSRLPTRFTLAGIASSKLRLVEDTPNGRTEYVCWRMEVGDLNSPGSFFHIQLGENDMSSQTYQPLPVPRIPCPPTTPLLALEYMIAELFQDDWPDRLVAKQNQARHWRRLQLARYEAFVNCRPRCFLTVPDQSSLT